MPATPAWLASIETLLNRSIAESVRAAAAARRLNNTAVQIEIEGVLGIRVAVAGDRLALTAPGAADAAADASISASPLALLALLARGALTKAGTASADLYDRADRPGGGTESGRGGTSMRGDAEIAHRYRELMVLARPDFEEELSRWVGDLPARRAAQAAKAALSWARNARRTAAQNLAEYLTEESRDLVGRPELEEFLSGVDQVRESTDRIEARLARLERRLKGGA